jgi:hypothetical protein
MSGRRHRSPLLREQAQAATIVREEEAVDVALREGHKVLDLIGPPPISTVLEHTR